MFSFCMQPDIKYGSKIYSRFQNDSDESIVCFANPILGVYENLDEKPLLITSEGGQGKTTSVQLLQAELLCKGVPCYIINCRDIAITDLRTLIPTEMMHKSVLICDGWDEIPNYRLRESIYMLEPFVTKLRHVIATSRYNPTINPVCDEEHRLFCEFNVAEICPFTKEQILELTEHKVSEDTRFFELLSNTMFLSMYLNLTEEDRQDIANAENAYKFIHRYFELLLSRKHQSVTNIDKLFYDVGEQVYLELRNEDSSFATNIGSISALNNIIEEYEDNEGNWRIDASHFRYRTFSLATYLKIILEKWISSSKSVPEQLSYSYESNYVEALIYLGESLDVDLTERIKSLIDYSSSDGFIRNLLGVLLGCNHQCFDDEIFCVTDDNLHDGEDYNTHPTITNFFHDNGFYIKGIHLHRLKIERTTIATFTWGLNNLQSIYVSNDHPTLESVGNCLVRKCDKTLLLGASRCELSNVVQNIGEYAFAHRNGIKKIEIPSTVKKIENGAFEFCYDLEELVISDSVQNIGGGIILGCYRLKKLAIGGGIKNIDPDSFSVGTDRTLYQLLSDRSFRSNNVKHSFPNLSQITMNANDKYYSEGNCIIDREQSMVVLGCSNSIIPNHVKIIGERAFDSIKVKNLVLPVGLEVIDSFAFVRSEFEKCILPNTLRKLHDCAFLECRCLGELELPSSIREVNETDFTGAKINRLIVPQGSRVVSCYDGDYSPYFKVNINIFLRVPDGSLISPPYFCEMKMIAKKIFDELYSGVFLKQSFNALCDDACKKITSQIKNTKIPEYWEHGEKAYETVLKQKAKMFLLKHLKESISIEDFYRRIE